MPSAVEVNMAVDSGSIAQVGYAHCKAFDA